MSVNTSSFSYDKYVCYACRPKQIAPCVTWYVLLTGAVIVCVVDLCPAAADAQEGFVVVVLIPIKGGDSRESSFSVAAYQAGGSGHHLSEGKIILEERGHDLEELLGTIPLEQLWGG